VADSEQFLHRVHVELGIAEFMDNPEAVGMGQNSQEIRHFLGQEGTPGHTAPKYFLKISIS
jgi:hypothetical protein